MSENKELTLTPSQRFAAQIAKQFVAEIGTAEGFAHEHQVLAQHLFIKMDSTIKELEARRINDNRSITPYTWQNINMQKLAIDAVHRIKLGLDALIPGHIYPIAYFNKKENKYDIDLRIGYIGKNYYRRENALDKPVDIRYELVRANDMFRPIKKDLRNKVEFYEFEIINPFERGGIVGGFGYIMFDNPEKNVLVILTKEDFDKSRKLAAGDTFWKNHPTEMMYKTLVHRTTEKLQLNPKSINSTSYAYVEAQDDEGNIADLKTEIEENANKEALDINPVYTVSAEEEEPPAENTTVDHEEDERGF